MTDEIMHHGVIGMKWGVRRYQNYDGSYTKKGVERYKQAESKYDSAKERRDTAKASGDKAAVRSAKLDMKAAKKEMNSSYKKLKTDKLADQGKELYKSGKTISANQNLHSTIAIGSAIAGGTVAKVLAENGRTDLAQAAALSAVGMNVVNALLYVKTSSENKKLRAYYAH